jgi:ADP-heptose:LPS heptosyltransferase
MRILALIPGTIGEQMLVFPTLDALKAVYPNAKIDLIVEPKAVAAYKVKSAVSEVFAFDFAGRSSLADWGNLLGIVRDREYNIALAPAPTWGISFLLWMSGIPTRIGFNNSAGANFLTAQVPLQPQQYAATMYQDLLGPIGIKPMDARIQVNLPKADLDWADGERQRLGLDRGGYVMVYSVDAGYPVNSWESILQEIQRKQPELNQVLLRDPQNPSFSLALPERLPSIKVTQPSTLGQTIAMLAGASLVITIEGDMLQATIAANTFTLGLFGAGDPEKLMPKRDRCLGLKSSTGKVADITASTILERLWQGS